MTLMQEPTSGQRSRNPLYDPKIRSFAVQLAVLVVVVLFFWSVIDNTISNLQRQNIASGFGFLDNPAGFGIVFSLVDYSEQSSYGRALLVGFLNTLLVAGVGIVFATLLGLTLGISRLSSNWLIAKLATVYIEVIRNIPLLLQIFFWYFAVLRALPSPKESHDFLGLVFVNNRGFSMPSIGFDGAGLLVAGALGIGIVASALVRRWAKQRRVKDGHIVRWAQFSPALIVLMPLLTLVIFDISVHVDVPAFNRFGYIGGWSIIPEFVALVLALSTYTAAFIAENVRSGIMAVSNGQSEAARALGLSEGRVLRFVVIPQALRVIIPPLTSQYLNLTKNSSLAVAIAYPDLVSVFSGTVLNQTGQAVEVIAITMTIYLSLSLLTSLLMNWYNRRVALVER